jgi:FKBP-type peptidyl-prolyl cis-trans isomerase
MKFSIAAAVAMALIAVSAGAQDTKKSAPPAASAPAGELKDQKSKVSYTLGVTIGKQFKAGSIDVDADLVVRGLKDILSGAKTALTEEQMTACMTEFQKEMMAKQQEMAAKQAATAKTQGEANRKAGDAFLAANAKKPGVKSTASGLQYKVLKEGTGKTPKVTDTVTTKYRGTLIDGTEFDSTEKHGQPSDTFGVSQVIKGWTEALQLMKEGAKYQLFIPAELAYGDNPRPGGPIQPGSLLIFEIELLKTEPAR